MKPLSPQEYRSALAEGIEFFNRGKYWDAHEGWERAWVSLEHGARRVHLQGLIQAAAAFHLLALGRTDPASRLCRASLEKTAQGHCEIEIEGLQGALNEILAAPENWRSHALSLRAKWREP